MNKEEKVYNIFQKIAGNYDAANDRMSLGMQKGWKHNLCNAVFSEIQSGNVLDVCCGTGDVAIALSERLSATGLDFSPAMLKIAEERKANVKWIQGSALSLPFADKSFNGATISFGLRNTADFRAVLEEMKRVIVPGGFLFVLDSFEPGKGFVYPFYKLYFKYIVPIIGGRNEYSEEYRWLNESTEEFLSPEELGSLMADIGLKDIKTEKYIFGACCLVYSRVV